MNAMTVEQAAAHFSTSARTLAKWVAAGMPGSFVSETSRRMIDVEMAADWVGRYKKEPSRRGPGRPAKGPKVPIPPKADDPITRGVTVGDTEPTDTEISTANAAEVDLIRSRIKAANELDARRKKAGELLDAADVEKTWTRTLQRVREAIHGLPSRIARDAAVELGMDQVAEVRLRRMIDEHIDRLSNDLAGGSEDGDGTSERVPQADPVDGERVGGQVSVHSDPGGDRALADGDDALPA
jgi:phage terminase Nu1 subunit (DNA packaging protein)